jgi:hypothetical protein
LRKISEALLCLTLFSFLSIPLFSQTADQGGRSKAIHIVYDDSVSMIKDRINENSPYIYSDRWAQNKYAMEVFAAMLEEKDSMSIYYLSHFDYIKPDNPNRGNLNAPPGITIKGSDIERVKKIHDKVTEAHNTPYNAVKKAYEDLKKTNEDEKWLVVLSDGEFNYNDGEEVAEGSIDVNEYFNEYKRFVKIIFFAMGDVAEKRKIEEEKEKIFFYQATDNKEILGKITEICNLIFNRNEFPRSEYPALDMREIEFDLPMEDILVFAQGPDIKINGIKGASSYSPVYTLNVRNTDREKASININFLNDREVITSNLTGVVAKFQNIPKGKYSLDIDGTLSQPANVYIKPKVNLQIKIFKQKKEILDFNGIPEDRYKIQYGILNEKGKFFEPKILKGLDITAELVNNEYSAVNSGDTKKLKHGGFTVNARAHYLDFNTKDATITGNVLDPGPWPERLKKWVQRNKIKLLTLWGLFMIWFLWFGGKKRFPRELKEKKPLITKEVDDSKITQNGKFKIIKKTNILPLCAEEATISVVPDGCPLTKFHVKAKDKDNMYLMNSSAFTPEKLSASGAELYIGSRPVRGGDGKKMEISCRATVKTVFPGRDGGPETRYTCSLAKSKK